MLQSEPGNFVSAFFGGKFWRKIYIFVKVAFFCQKQPPGVFGKKIYSYRNFSKFLKKKL